MWPAVASIPASIPILLAGNRSHDIAEDFGSALHASNPARTPFRRGRRCDLRQRHAIARHHDRLPCLSDLFQNRGTPRFEFGNGDLLHVNNL